MNESIRKLHLVKLFNGDDETIPVVIAIVEAEGAALWAKEEMGTIEGERWESDGDEFAYVSFLNTPGLLARLESEGYRFDASEFIEAK